MIGKDTSRDFDVPLMERQKPCGCGGVAFFSRHCGVYVCDDCNAHIGLARCYCGWSASGSDGRRELEEMGETIGDEPGADNFFDEVPW